MSDTGKIPLAMAEGLADQVVGHLFDETTVAQFDIAGSIRRGKQEVSDIELVCLAKRHETNPDLFGEPQDVDVPLERRVNQLLGPRLRARIKRNGTMTMGPKCKYMWFYSGVDLRHRFKVDLFIVHDPRQYGLILAIRTGGAEFSQRLVSRRAPFGGGLLPRGWSVKGGWLYNANGDVVETPSEQALFDALDLPFIEPADRDTFVLDRVTEARYG